MSIRSDAMRTLIFQGCMLGAGVVTNVVVARTLGPSGKGLLSFLSYALFVTVSLGSLGLQVAAIQHLGKKSFQPGTVAATQIILGLLAGLVCAGVLFLLLPAYRGRMDLGSELVLPFLLVVVFSLLLLNVSGVVIGMGRIQVSNLIQLLPSLVWMLGVVVVVGLLKGDRTAAALTWMAAMLTAPLAALGWIFAHARPRMESFAACARASLRFGLEAYVANLLWTFLLRVDGLLMGTLSGPASVGIYSVAVLLAEMLWYLPRALTLALNPRIASGTREEAFALTHRAVRVAIWTAAVAALGLLALSRPLILLAFGPSFLASVRPLALLLPGIVAVALASPLSLYLTQQRGLPRINAWISGVGLAVNLGLNLYWIPRRGPAGAALASTVAYSLVAALLLWRIRREPGFSWSALLIPRREDFRSFRDALAGFLPKRASRRAW